MKFNFTNEDFEKFIKQQADQLRMRPSDKVWNNISGEIHTRRRWVGLGLLLFVISATSVSTLFLLTHNSPKAAGYTVTKPAVQTGSSTESKNTFTGSDRETGTNKTSTINTSRQGNNSFAALRYKPKTGAQSLPYRYSETGKQDANLTSATESESSRAEESNPNTFEGTFADSEPFGENKTAKETNRLPDQEPYSIESVTNKYRGKQSKLSWQFYFTPTVSYRKLSENKSYLRKVQQQPNNASINFAELYNINDVVTHRPDIGMELGIAAKYELGKHVKIRAGLQFNLSHYDIKAFDVYTPQVATIALNVGDRVDSVNTVTKYRNLAGPTTSWLQNYYYQMSIPVGIDVILSKRKAVQFGISTTIQPTYILGERAYMISSDYQNYTKVPWLMRKWNVNTSLETFVSYSTGQLKWQVGPQVRYQLLSSFMNEYPVKENLFDFGLKVGVGLNK